MIAEPSGRTVGRRPDPAALDRSVAILAAETRPPHRGNPGVAKSRINPARRFATKIRPCRPIWIDFVDAQQPVFEQVLDELRAGRKQTHWMWFVFPQLRSLGRSATARHFGLADLAEARAFAAHHVLGPRLVACSNLLLDLHGRSAHQIFGSPDDLKLCSCMSLFERTADDGLPFAAVIDRYCAGARDPLTVQALDADATGAGGA